MFQALQKVRARCVAFWRRRAIARRQVNVTLDEAGPWAFGWILSVGFRALDARYSGTMGLGMHPAQSIALHIGCHYLCRAASRFVLPGEGICWH